MYTITDKSNYFRVDMDGIVVFDEILAILQDLYSRPNYHQKNDLWVFGDGRTSMQFEHLEQITEYISQGYPSEATRTRTALVVKPGMGEAIVEIWATTARCLPYEIKIFGDTTAAEIWLAE